MMQEFVCGFNTEEFRRSVACVNICCSRACTLTLVISMAVRFKLRMSIGTGGLGNCI